MEVLNERIIEVGLNAIGYVAAGLLWMLIYSAFSWKHHLKSTAAEPAREAKATGQSDDTAAVSADGKKPEFISFQQSDGSDVQVTRVSDSSDSNPEESRRRNRAEIIKLARRMLQEGASGENIRKSLPIADGELALLNRNNE